MQDQCPFISICFYPDPIHSSPIPLCGHHFAAPDPFNFLYQPSPAAQAEEAVGTVKQTPDKGCVRSEDESMEAKRDRASVCSERRVF